MGYVVLEISIWIHCLTGACNRCSIYLLVYLPVYQSTYLSISQSVNQLFYQSIYQSIYLFISQSVSSLVASSANFNLYLYLYLYISDRNTVDKIRREYNLSIFFLLSYINLKVEAIMTVIHHTSPFNTTLHKNFFLTLFFYRSYPIYGVDWKVRD